MLDINYIRQNLDKVKKSVADRNIDVDLENLLKLDDHRKELIQTVDAQRQKRNTLAKEKNIEEGRKIKEELSGLEKELKEKEEEWSKLMLQIPNIILDGVPSGDETHFDILYQVGEKPVFNFEVKDHVELGEKLDIIDIARAAKVSGSRFAYLKNKGALLELALIQYAMNKLVDEGFSPIIPPAIINMKMTQGLGYWQRGGHVNYYYLADPKENGEQDDLETDLYLIGTGEHAIVPMHQDEILSEDQLPKKYAAFSPCFRREVGTGGQDIRGILRVHQFDKVEMVEFVKPQDDERERKKMLSLAESFLKELGLPYQVKKLASGDISFPAAETIDIETWIPSQKLYRETHSISTTTDFQSRRLKIRYKEKDNTVSFVHVLNGTALAIGRMIIAILENFQQADGSVKIPEVLQKYTGFSEITP